MYQSTAVMASGTLNWLPHGYDEAEAIGLDKTMIRENVTKRISLLEIQNKLLPASLA